MIDQTVEIGSKTRVRIDCRRMDVNRRSPHHWASGSSGRRLTHRFKKEIKISRRDALQCVSTTTKAKSDRRSLGEGGKAAPSSFSSRPDTASGLRMLLRASAILIGNTPSKLDGIFPIRSELAFALTIGRRLAKISCLLLSWKEVGAAREVRYDLLFFKWLRTGVRCSNGPPTGKK